MTRNEASILLFGFIFLSGLCPKVQAAGYGIIGGGPWVVTTGRSKIRARPTLFTLIGATIDRKNEVDLKYGFGGYQDACGRGAEVQLRIEKTLLTGELGDVKKAAAIKTALRMKMDGLCFSSIEFLFQPWPRLVPGQILSWAKVLGEVTGTDYKLVMNLPPLSSERVEAATLTFKEGEEILKFADGLSLYFHDTQFAKAEDFRSLLKKNIVWATQMTLKTDKKVVLFIPAFQELNNNKVVPITRNLTEGVRAIKTLTKEEAAGLCSGAVRIALHSARLDDPKQDLEVTNFEKWLTHTCPTSPG